MRREELYLTDIVEACAAVGRFIYSKSRDQFAGDDLLRSAVLQKLTIIGEAAARLPEIFGSNTRKSNGPILLPSVI